MSQWAGRKKACSLGSKKVWVDCSKIDHLLTVGDRDRALTVGDPADELVGEVDQGENAELAAGVAPTLGSIDPMRARTRDTRGIVIRRLTGQGLRVALVAWKRPEKRRVRAIRDAGQ